MQLEMTQRIATTTGRSTRSFMGRILVHTFVLLGKWWSRMESMRRRKLTQRRADLTEEVSTVHYRKWCGFMTLGEAMHYLLTMGNFTTGDSDVSGRGPNQTAPGDTLSIPFHQLDVSLGSVSSGPSYIFPSTPISVDPFSTSRSSKGDSGMGSYASSPTKLTPKERALPKAGM